jgi:hypothetical protein
MVMLLGRIAVLTLAVVMIAVAREPAQTTVTVKELPPEAIPTGPCVESIAGFLGVVGMGQKERTKLTAEEIRDVCLEEAGRRVQRDAIPSGQRENICSGSKALGQRSPPT